MDILAAVFDLSSATFDFDWQDDQGNNVLSYIGGLVSGHSHCNIDVMKRVSGEVPKAQIKKLLRMKDAKGKVHTAKVNRIELTVYLGIAPITRAYHRDDKTLYNLWIGLDSSAAKFAIDNYNKDDFPGHATVSPMEVDHISLAQIDNDAQIERENLQRLKDLEKAQDESAQSIEKDEKLKVDPYAKLSKVGVLAMDASNQPYDIMLMKVELNSWGSNTDTS